MHGWLIIFVLVFCRFSYAIASTIGGGKVGGNVMLVSSSLDLGDRIGAGVGRKMLFSHLCVTFLSHITHSFSFQTRAQNNAHY